MGFNTSTRVKYLQQPTITKPAGGGTSPVVEIPRSGIFSRLFLQISATVAGSLSNPNALGACSIIRRVRLTMNNGVDLINISGAGYCYLMSNFIDNNQSVVPQNTGKNAVTATTFNLDMVLPIAMNNRDEYGLVLVQNDQSLASLTIEWETDSVVATGATVTATCVPFIMSFEVPADPANWPSFGTAHQIIEDQIVVSGAGEWTYHWPRGNVYLGVYHLIPGAYTNARLRAQQSIYLYDLTPDQQRMLFACFNNADPNLSGTAITGYNKRVFYDLLGSDGLGTYGAVRDVIDSSRLTDLASVIQVSGATTIYTVRRQLVFLSPSPQQV